MIFAFLSTAQDASEVAAELRRRFPASRIAGCTTAGEILSGNHFTGTLTLAGVTSARTRWATDAAPVDGFDLAAANASLDRMLSALGRTREDLDPRRHFCLLFIDGLAMREEGVASAMAEALAGVPLIGGSAGDDMKFARTRVLSGGEALDRAVSLVLAECDEGFSVLKHQHFVRTRRLLAVTRVDAERRRVIELDGLPAAEAYARALGVEAAALTPAMLFSNPLSLGCSGEMYIRSAQRLEEDQSILFYCAIEEGMVLDVSSHLDISHSLEEALAPRRKSEFLLACNCILRALEARQDGSIGLLGRILHEKSAHVVGFETYGEQFNGLHINQTLVGLAIGGEA